MSWWWLELTFGVASDDRNGKFRFKVLGDGEGDSGDGAELISNRFSEEIKEDCVRWTMGHCFETQI